ncbi:amino acid transporter [Leucobacter tardus]|uniref:Amino acid transporter n=1 Tax=Leucobacter tardus TaxID=501483 RepID=A0A939QH70_9MICO|nr:amino acid transporter [Leucobacter tardus]MBO2990023.1 amino acid transporter [Leucobacter tardus]
MCLTGVDYFSTLGYQPALAAVAAGAIAPVATLVLVLVTLCGALPVYRRVARESPHGTGSLAMLASLFPHWRGKLIVLVLLGFVATDFMITMTLSAADATAHLVENPAVARALGTADSGTTPAGESPIGIGITIIFLLALALVFLRGFSEAIRLASVLVAGFLALNAVVIAVSLGRLVDDPPIVTDWWGALTTQHGDPWLVVAIALLVFPKLALGLSGFETGVAVMPQIRGNRIAGARKLLATSAAIMSVFLITSSLVTVTLIPASAFGPEGEAHGRALAYLAHEYLGEGFGSVYDATTIAILWFAGASALAGLINVVGRYLPHYGMAPAWTRATRPLVLVLLGVAIVVTLAFGGSVEAQGGAYATGVLVLICSAALAVTVSAHRAGQRVATRVYAGITAVFAYTAGANIVERPDGIKVAACFVGGILIVSAVSRIARSTELRATAVHLDDVANAMVAAPTDRPLLLIAHDPRDCSAERYRAKLRHAQAAHGLCTDGAIFLEVSVTDSSEFEEELQVSGTQRHGFPVLEVNGPTVPNALAAVALSLRDQSGREPHLFFHWTEGNPILEGLRFFVLGEGEIAAVTREVLRAAEHDPARRPWVHAA